MFFKWHQDLWSILPGYTELLLLETEHEGENPWDVWFVVRFHAKISYEEQDEAKQCSVLTHRARAALGFPSGFSLEFVFLAHAESPVPVLGMIQRFAWLLRKGFWKISLQCIGWRPWSDSSGLKGWAGPQSWLLFPKSAASSGGAIRKGYPFRQNTRGRFLRGLQMSPSFVGKSQNCQCPSAASCCVPGGRNLRFGDISILCFAGDVLADLNPQTSDWSGAEPDWESWLQIFPLFPVLVTTIKARGISPLPAKGSSQIKSKFPGSWILLFWLNRLFYFTIPAPGMLHPPWDTRDWHFPQLPPTCSILPVEIEDWERAAMMLFLLSPHKRDMENPVGSREPLKCIRAPGTFGESSQSPEKQNWWQRAAWNPALGKSLLGWTHSPAVHPEIPSIPVESRLNWLGASQLLWVRAAEHASFLIKEEQTPFPRVKIQECYPDIFNMDHSYCCLFFPLWELYLDNRNNPWLQTK